MCEIVEIYFLPKFVLNPFIFMKLLNANQIKSADKFTLEEQKISSLQLMERAAETAVEYLISKFRNTQKFYIFCGKGNNGGDGFAIARLLYQKSYDVEVFTDLSNINFSDEAKTNFQKVKSISGIDLNDFSEVENMRFKANSIILDCIFGIGLNRKIEGKIERLIQVLNTINLKKNSIDIPSGLLSDGFTPNDFTVLKADETLSFQLWKKAFFYPETGRFCGKIQILNICISENFIASSESTEYIIDEHLIKNIYQPREDFVNKGTFGKTVMIAGSYGKIGAAVLATKAALKSGSGLTFCAAPKCGYNILQNSAPEAMFIESGENFIEFLDLPEDGVLGIGPGLGTEADTEKVVLNLIKNQKMPTVIDADALNILSKNKDFLKYIPTNSIITPHPKEFERLFGASKNAFERTELAKQKAKELNIFIVLKGHHTQIISPEKEVFYNITGNSGMAKGGSGDALTGIITSFLSQNYSPKNAAIFGVWLHGKAGDFAAEKYSKESMLPSDLIENIAEVFKDLQP